MIFPEGQRPEGYITNKLLNISRCISDIYTDWTLLRYYKIHISHAMVLRIYSAYCNTRPYFISFLRRVHY